MTIFYFTSTGNCLSVAKKIGGTLVSIPQIFNRLQPEYRDDKIGVIFPIYGFGTPKMVEKFLIEVKLIAKYTFIIGTYGNLPGAAMLNVQKLANLHGYKFDYAESLLMVDNYLPGFDIKDQIAKLPEKKTDKNLARIVSDIHAGKQLQATAGVTWRIATTMIKFGKKIILGAGQCKNYIIDDKCVKCGVCSKVCPSGNIKVRDNNVIFGDNCEACEGCVHLCPKNAIHMKQEKSAERWRNPDVSLVEIIAANNRM